MKSPLNPILVKKGKAFLSLLMIAFFISCKPSIEIIQKPIVFDEKRVQLTKDYLRDRYGIDNNSIEIDPKMIVLHHTVIPTFEETFDAFDPSLLPNARGEIAGAGSLNVSSHFVVDRDGTIYQLMPTNHMARHVIGLNHCAIGIENVGDLEKKPLTQEQLKANIALVYHLSDQYDIDYLIGHREYQKFEGHRLWLEKDDGYRTKKDDPSDGFLQQVRNATKSLKFEAIPN